MTAPLPLIVVSDLDGTLLDHAGYGFDAARPALAALKARGIPLVLASSKTGAEIAVLQREMGIEGAPAIVENGAGIAWDGAVASDDAAYRRLRKTLAGMPEAAGFRGFGDMSDGEVAEVTGLRPEAAALARQRCHSEPGVWSGEGEAAFVAALARHGISARRGGRFLTLSFGRTKADAMAEVAARLGARQVVALGDAPNDAEMLEAADIAVIVRNPHAPPMPDIAPKGRLMRTEAEGPEGWNAAVLEILENTDRRERHRGHG